MFDPLVPYNELPYITTLYVDTTSGLARLAEDTRVAIEILRYAVKTLPDPNILLDTLALQEAKASSNVENIVTTNDDLYRGVIFEDFTAEAKEVSCYKDALFEGYGRMQAKGLISMSDIDYINRPVNKKQKGIRTNLPNFDLTRIANQKPNGEQEIIYTPPHGKDLLQELLIDMLDYIYDDDSYTIHQAFDGISTNVAAADKTYSVIDEIIEKFNLRYADAEVIIKDIMTALSDDADLHSNVRDSSPSAYEAVVDERVDSTIMDGMFNSMMAGDSERAEFFSELSENKPVKMQIRNSIIRRIKDFLLSA